MKTINTVTGTITTDKLGTTLMHEHLLVGWAGWELDCKAPRFDRKAALKGAIDRLKELKDLGLETFLDPCPNDIGRDVVFMAEVGRRERRQYHLHDRSLQGGPRQHGLLQAALGRRNRRRLYGRADRGHRRDRRSRPG